MAPGALMTLGLIFAEDNMEIKMLEVKRDEKEKVSLGNDTLDRVILRVTSLVKLLEEATFKIIEDINPNEQPELSDKADQLYWLAGTIKDILVEHEISMADALYQYEEGRKKQGLERQTKED